jgi:hypothetical protein
MSDSGQCIRHTHEDLKGTSWCGRALYSSDWVFQSLDQAACAQMGESCQVPCKRCLKTATDALKGNYRLPNQTNSETLQTSLDDSAHGHKILGELQRIVDLIGEGQVRLDSTTQDITYSNLWDLYD